MEHDQVCCDKTLTFRPRFWSTLDVLIVSMVLLNLMSLIINSSWDILISLLITGFLLWLSYLVYVDELLIVRGLQSVADPNVHT